MAISFVQISESIVNSKISNSKWAEIILNLGWEIFETIPFIYSDLPLFMILFVKNIKILMNNISAMIIEICIYGIMAIIMLK